MRGPLPLRDDDFAEVRAEVLRRIARPRRAPWGQLVALAASVVVAVVSVRVARVPAVAPPLTRRIAPLSATLSPLRGARDTRVTALPSAPLPLPGEGGAKRRARVARKRPHHKPVAVARMEIRTADPNIRIIWITN